MNLRQLRYVVVTADSGTMTAAANSLYIAQPALSRAIRDLERELGMELFARAGRGVVLTEAGVGVVRYAREALRATEAIEALAAGRGRGGELRIAATPALESELTGHLLPGFARDQPAIRIRVVRCPGPESERAALREGRADLAVSSPPVPADLTAHVLERREIVLVTPAGARLTPAALDFLAFAGARGRGHS